MPGTAGSPYWTAVDFDSEGDDVPSPLPNHRIYLDPWDQEVYEMTPADATESSLDNFNSFAGEPVSASFYYVPTKNYDSAEEPPLPPPRRRTPEQISPDYSMYGRKFSRSLAPDFAEPMYGDKPIRDHRRSGYIEEPMYVPLPMIYEPIYGPAMPPPPGYMPLPRSRMSLPHQPDYVMAGLGYGKPRRHSRMADAYEQLRGAYESLSPEYEDWARPLPKTAPDNFHLSRYGHLQIDYSCSWNSLDRLIRNQ